MGNINEKIKEAQKEVVKGYILEVAKRIASLELDIKVLESLDKETVVSEHPSQNVKGASVRVTAEEQLKNLKEILEHNKISLEVAREELKRY